MKILSTDGKQPIKTCEHTTVTGISYVRKEKNLFFFPRFLAGILVTIDR